MKRSRYICAATMTGAVHLIDPTTFEVVKTWQPHAAYINDMDAQGDFIVTCGASMKPAQGCMLDLYVNVYDLKNMTAMSPVPFPPGAAYVRLHPRMLTTSIVISQLGQMHVVDLLNPNAGNVRYAQYLTTFEIAPSGEALAMAGVDGGIVHLWGSPSKVRFNDLQAPIELPPPPEPSPIVDLSPDT